MGVWFSCFTTTVQPSRRARSGQAYWGVAGIAERTTAVACSRSSSVNIALAFVAARPDKSCPSRFSRTSAARLRALVRSQRRQTSIAPSAAAHEDVGSRSLAPLPHDPVHYPLVPHRRGRRIGREAPVEA